MKMMDFTATWGWPQWAILVMMVLSLMIFASKHGDERLETSGERKGKPERYNAFVAIIRFGIIMFILIAGGFFS
jgi:hypothetical protein